MALSLTSQKDKEGMARLQVGYKLIFYGSIDLTSKGKRESS